MDVNGHQKNQLTWFINGLNTILMDGMGFSVFVFSNFSFFFNRVWIFKPYFSDIQKPEIWISEANLILMYFDM